MLLTSACNSENRGTRVFDIRIDSPGWYENHYSFVQGLDVVVYSTVKEDTTIYVQMGGRNIVHKWWEYPISCSDVGQLKSCPTVVRGNDFHVVVDSVDARNCLIRVLHNYFDN